MQGGSFNRRGYFRAPSRPVSASGWVPGPPATSLGPGTAWRARPGRGRRLGLGRQLGRLRPAFSTLWSGLNPSDLPISPGMSLAQI